MWPQTHTRFKDRRQAGQQLAAELAKRAIAAPVVLALPRGGVPVGYEVAQRLNAPLDVLLVRKIGAPGQEEFGIGAVVDGAHPQVVLNAESVQMLCIPPSYIEQEQERLLREIERRRRLYSGSEGPIDVADRNVIVVDDGIATGGTMLVALYALKHAAPQRVIAAIPVAPPETLTKLASEADEVVCLAAPPDFHAVGVHYDNFEQTSDREVIELLTRQRDWLRSVPGER